MAEETLAFAPNYNHVIEIDITPTAASPTWAYALYGIKKCDPKPNETTSDDEYYHNLGHTESEVEKVDWTIELSGSRCYGDPAQDFVVGVVNEIGEGRKTRYRWTQPDGTYMEGRCTLRDIVPGMGDPSAKGDFSYTIAVNSIDEYESPSLDGLPTAVAITKPTTLKVGATAKATATVTPATANQKCHFAVDDESVATVDADGTMKGVKAGKVTLTVKAASKPSVTAQEEVTVSAS